MDNERPIEKLLRRYAQKRRDDPAVKRLEMHPATRRMLQGEVSRQFEVRGARGQGSGASPDPSHLTPRTLTKLWPRLVWALPVSVVLVVGVWAIVHSRKPQEIVGELAKTEPLSPMPFQEPLARTETPAPSARGVTPPNEAAPATLALAESSRAKDTSTFGFEEGKLKTDRAPASPVLNTPAPGAAAPVTQVANLDAAIQEKAVASRDALERLAGDARADSSRDLTLTARPAPAGEPVATARRKLETVRAGSTSAATDSLAVARNIAGDSETAGFNRTGTLSLPPAAAPQLSLSDTPTVAKVEEDRAQMVPPTVVQKFIQTTAAPTSGSLAKKSAEMPPVLEAFQVEQTGNQLRVIDSDGSSYNGSIQFTTAESFDDTESATKRTDDFKNTRIYRQVVKDKGVETQMGQNYFFSVTGTNRTLKQPVAFTGNLLVLTNALPATQNGLTFAPVAKGQFPLDQTASPALLNSSISGKVQLGTEKEMRINAVPVAR